MKKITLVFVWINKQNANTGSFLKILKKLSKTTTQIEILIVGNIPATLDKDLKKISQFRADFVSLISSSSPDELSSVLHPIILNRNSDWIVFCDSLQISLALLQNLEALLTQQTDNAIAMGLVTSNADLNDDGLLDASETRRFPVTRPVSALGNLLRRPRMCLLRRDLLREKNLTLDSDIAPGFQLAALTACYLIHYSDKRVMIIPDIGDTSLAGCADNAGTRDWRNPKTYDLALKKAYLQPLEDAARVFGSPPSWLQSWVLQDLKWYFETDRQERAPTVVVTEPMATVFHDLVQQIIRQIDLEMIAALRLEAVHPEVLQALMSYKERQSHSTVWLTAYDHDQRLARINYFIQGALPIEFVRFDDSLVQPAYAKYRACRFFRRTLFRERIAWFPVMAYSSIEVMLDNQPISVVIGACGFDSAEFLVSSTQNHLLDQIKSDYPIGKGFQPRLPINIKGIKARILRWLAGLSVIKRKYLNAWILFDRQINADDNAESMYRWICSNYPEINIWFLLKRSSSDWNRLKKDGFNLISEGIFCKLLFLNCDHIIASHSEYEYGNLDPNLYGDLMTWRYSFVPHGISKDDASHWLGKKSFDLFITTSQDEYESIVADDTPYSFTCREVRLTGFPRHDQIISINKSLKKNEINYVLVMPTWRASLIDGRLDGYHGNNIYDSSYIHNWRSLLNNTKLTQFLAENEKKLVFMPHQNAIPFIDEFNVPDHVQIIKKFSKEILCRSSALITDYSSIAFEMALIRRLVIYYQFDRESFYGGDHNWREGYFDYARDGFGPVCLTESDVLQQLAKSLANHAQPDPMYLDRMKRALPDHDGRACERVFENILSLTQPFS
jgi:hypothetical protein